MAVYRFRVCLEENEDISRDIDIKSTQTFEEFHLAIMEAIKFDNKQAASFFVSDDYWRKNQEITLRKEDLPLDEDEIRKKVEPKKLMGETKIAKFIEQPHQRFFYIYDAVVQWAFLIEMIKMVDENPKTKYPTCIKSLGTAPKQYKNVKIIKDEVSPDLTMAGLLNAAELDEDEDDDEEVYKVIDTGEEAVEADDINSLEGEEGEDEATEEDEELNEDMSEHSFNDDDDH